jgi:isoquinoline 1-oxidoreductase beta subunit
VLEAEYLFPYLAHAPLEPLDGVIEWRDGKAEVWMGSQLQTVDHNTMAAVLGTDAASIAIHTMFAGGSFGRLAQPGGDFAAELAQVAKAGGDGAYKLLWTREDDIQGGFYRPLTVHRLRAGLDAEGQILGWENTIVNQTIVGGTPFEGFIREGIDPMAVEGSRNMPYAWPANRLAWVPMESPVSVLWWRSVGHSHTAYATETFLDELLAAGGQDPVAGRLALMKSGFERLAGALEKVAELADWQGPKGSDGRAFGVAVHKSFGSYAATIAEVSDNEGVPRVHRVWCAIDCGVAINPNVIRAQIEGGIGYGLSAAMFNEITLAEGGEIEQRNFDTYRLLRIDEMPAVEVAVVKSGEAPTGVGEPGLPPIAPAVANAYRALTGKTPRQLPFSRLNA